MTGSGGQPFPIYSSNTKEGITFIRLMYFLVISIHHVYHSSGQTAHMWFLNGAYPGNSDIPPTDPNHSKSSSSRECETSSLPSPSRIPILSLECFLFPRCSRHGSPIFSKYIFLLMKRKRTTRRTIKTPTADKKPMASGGTGKRTQKKKNHHY